MTDPTPAEALKAGDDGPCTDCDDTGITFQTERRCACQGPMAPKTETLAELEARAITAAAYRLTCSPHEWTDDDSEAMAAYILARAALPSPATDAGEAGSCVLCKGACRGHSLGHPEEWEPEKGSVADAGEVRTAPSDDWQPIESPPKQPMGVLLWIPGARQENILPGNDYSIVVGFWSHGEFREQGTGHDLKERLESWGGDGQWYPTYWCPLPAPPAVRNPDS